MKRILRCSIWLVLVFLALPLWAQQPAAEAESEEAEVATQATGADYQPVVPTVNLRYGSLNLMGVFQSRMDYRLVGDDFDNSTFSFGLQRARLILSGHVVTEGLQYFFQGDAAHPSGSWVLDAALSYVFTNSLAIKVGRFVPDFSIMMPRNTADLGVIDYPLYLTAGNFVVWRQLGVQASMRPVPLFSFAVGAFNGMLVEPTATYRIGGVPSGGRLYMPLLTDVGLGGSSNVADNNSLKDFLVRMSLHLSPAVTLGLHLWFGFPHAYTVAQAADGSDRLVFASWAGDRNTSDLVLQGGLSAEYRTSTMHVAGEVMARTVSFDQAMPTSVAGLTDTAERIDSLMSLGAWLHFGYLYDGWLEGVFRVDWLEPAMEDIYDTDQVIRVTVGPQFWLESGNHFRILVNYFTNLYYQDDNRDPDHNIQTQFQALW
ncbi:MAG: hypothetical protein JW797_07735 [Bradymonadales bacterium]|nr:hypothetical protein [Bradymonadales bacterium]